MKKMLHWIAVSFIIFLFIPIRYDRVEAKGWTALNSETDNSREFLELANSAHQADVNWPQPVGFHRVGQIEMTITSSGIIGNSGINASTDPETGLPLRSFTFPRGSRHSYLWGAGLWVGGIIDDDTLVSLALSDAYLGIGHFLPVDSGGSVTLIGGPGDKQFRVQYDDNFPGPAWHEPNLKKLRNIRITEISRSWTYSPHDYFILMELAITNIGDRPIQDAYIGYYVDGDVADRTNGNGFADDVAGFIKSEGIAYIIDNNGDPRNNQTWTDTSVLGAMGVALVYSDPPAAKTSFNWWNRFTPEYGPQYLGTPPQSPRYMADGGLGDPVNASDRYYLLSNGEIDYDQIYAAIMNADSGWLPAGTTAGTGLAFGFDTRYVLGYGPYQLPPGDSVHLVLAFAGGDNIHQNPADYFNYFDAQNPSDYYNRLDFSDLINNVRSARILFESDYALALRPGEIQGVKVFETGDTEIKASWLPKLHTDIEGYNVYIKPVPDSQLIFEDTVCRYTTDTIGMALVNHNGLISDTFLYIGELIDGQTYFLSVTAVNFFSESPKSFPRYFTLGTPDPPVTCPDPTYVSNTEQVTIRWIPPTESDIDHYNIYRYVGAYDYSLRYKPRITTRPISGRQHDSLHIIVDGSDTIQFYFYDVIPYAQVIAPETSFIDPITDAELYYLVTAIDTAGQESDTSRTIPIYATSFMPYDFLILIDNDGEDHNLESIDTVINYYNDILSDYMVNYFILSDSAQGYVCDDSGCRNVCLNKECFSWASFAPYKCVIIDENMLKPIISRYDFIVPFDKILTDYIRSGGFVVYFGNFADAIMPYGLDTLTRHFQPGSKEYELFGLDSVLLNGVGLHFNGLIGGGRDTIGGFIGATAAITPFEQLTVDTTYDWWNFAAQHMTFWPYATPPQTATMYPRAGAETVYWYDALSPQTSLFDGLPCGVRFSAYGQWHYSFGFHPWYLPKVQSAALFDVILNNQPTDVDDPIDPLPTRMVLHQNFPNPFNLSTTIALTLPHSGDVTLDIYNILGQRVCRLVDEFKTVGNHVIQWHGRDDRGDEVASGIYFYRLNWDNKPQTRKMLLIK